MNSIQDKQPIETAHISLHGNRRDNQDRYAVLEHQGIYLLVLADGLGGHPKGEVAAEKLIHAAELFFPSQFNIKKPVETFFQLIINHAHHQTSQYGEQQEPPIKPRTTAVLALIDNQHIHWGHVGDSRLYLFRNSKIMFRTKDHTYAEELKRRGLNPETQHSNPKNIHSLVRCVGGGKAPPPIEMGPKVPLLIKDTVLLCSDGFWGQIESRKVSRAFEANASLSLILSTLGQQALESAFPRSDNVTAIALKKWGRHKSIESHHESKTPKTDDLHQAIDSLEDFIKKVEQEIKDEH